MYTAKNNNHIASVDLTLDSSERKLPIIQKNLFDGGTKQKMAAQLEPHSHLFNVWFFGAVSDHFSDFPKSDKPTFTHTSRCDWPAVVADEPGLEPFPLVLVSPFLHNSSCHLNATPWMPSRRYCAPFYLYLNYRGYCSKIWMRFLTNDMSNKAAWSAALHFRVWHCRYRSTSLTDKRYKSEWSYFNPKYHIFLNRTKYILLGETTQTVSVCWG